MTPFEDVTLYWQGEQHKVPADRVMTLVYKLEDVLRDGDSRQAVEILLDRHNPLGLAKMARAYAVCLGVAGVDVTADQIYMRVQAEMAEGTTAAAAIMDAALMGIMAILSPPIHRKLMAFSGDGDEGKPAPAGETTAA